jgi:hypothetical protein
MVKPPVEDTPKVDMPPLNGLPHSDEITFNFSVRDNLWRHTSDLYIWRYTNGSIMADPHTRVLYWEVALNSTTLKHKNCN